MKLFLFAKWGTLEDGYNGPDTCLLVAGNTLEFAAKGANDHLRKLGCVFLGDKPTDVNLVDYAIWLEGSPDDVERDDGSWEEAKVFLGPFIAYAHNLRRNPEWACDHSENKAIWEKCDED